MHGSRTNVLAFLAAPSREDSLRAISLCLLRIRSKGVTCAELGRALECSADTIENATNEGSLLSFDTIARIGYHFPDEFAIIEELWMGREPKMLSVSDRVERIERELSEICRMTGERVRA